MNAFGNIVNTFIELDSGSESESERSTSDGCKRAADGSNDEGMFTSNIVRSVFLNFCLNFFE